MKTPPHRRSEEDHPFPRRHPSLSPGRSLQSIPFTSASEEIFFQGLSTSSRHTCKHLPLPSYDPKGTRVRPLLSQTRVLLILVFIFAHLVTGALCVKIKEIRMPEPGIYGGSARLECVYDMDANDLYSIRWSLNGVKFYSFVRRNSPEKVDHNLANVRVQLSESDNRGVTLSDLSLSAEGTYQCEIMEEAPTFEKASLEKNLTIVKLPDLVEITGIKKHYRDGETLQATCTAQHSWPAATIFFSVNGHRIDNKSGLVETLEVYHERGPSYFPKGSYASSSRLTLRLTGTHAPEFHLGCHAVVKTIPKVKVVTVSVSRPLFSFFNSGAATERFARHLVAPVAVVILLLH